MTNDKKILWTTLDDSEWLALRRSHKKSAIKRICRFLLGPTILLGFLILFSVMWTRRQFGDVTPEMMVMQLRMPLQGTGGNLYLSFIIQAALPTLVITIAITVLERYIRQMKSTLFVGKTAVFPNVATSMVLAAIFFVASFSYCTKELELPQYIANRNKSSDFIEQNYVIPKTENLVFPEQKRNLIYIYMESMESTFFSTEQGGQMPQSIIPELFDIAQDNFTFSHHDKVGGGVPLVGTGVTSAGMVSQTAGIPLYLAGDWEGEGARDIFISNATTLGDILEENGYAQYLMVGSDSTFGARDLYYTNHGNATIFDLMTAHTSGIISEDYHNGFWGMEDKYLYEYAKQELTQISQEEKPFCFTMLTVDTHFPDGYLCDLCENEFSDPYSNVLACSSRQIGSFIQWIQQQDFYKDTTIIITGDHLSMNTDYFKRNNLNDNERRLFNAFINPAEDVEPLQTSNRMFASIDVFPSTLAALGVKIDGNRLGLGTNLFSNMPTLLELYGYDLVNNELSQKSEFYNYLNKKD